MDRAKVAALTLSAAAFVGIAVHEGFRDTAYLPTKNDVPTIGFGTTEGVKPGDKITVERALIRALQDAEKFSGAVKRCVKVPLYQHEFDAYVSFSYNVGEGAFCGSTMVRLLNQGKYEEACRQMDRWVYQKGQKLPGLVKRRAEERNKCLGVTNELH
jgi:lysozyme